MQVASIGSMRLFFAFYAEGERIKGGKVGHTVGMDMEEDLISAHEYTGLLQHLTIDNDLIEEYRRRFNDEEKKDEKKNR